MRLSLLTSAAITLLLIHTPVATAADDALPVNVRKHFDYFVGQWEMTGTGQAGNAVSSVQVRWAPGKHSILFNSGWSDPKSQSLGSGIFGWNAVEEKIQLTEFWDDGYYHHRLFTIESDKIWEGPEFSGGNDEGKPIRGNMRIEILGPNEWSYKSSNLTVGGQPEQDDNLVFRRKLDGSKGQTSTPEEFKEFGDLLVGRWMGEITLIADWPGQEKKQGDTITGYTRYRWIADGKGLEWEGVSGTTTGKTLVTYDARSNRIRTFHVGSGGTHWQTVIWKKSDTEWRWKITRSSLVDGRELTGAGAWVIDEDGKRHVIQGKAQLDGEELPKLHDVYIRVDNFAN